MTLICMNLCLKTPSLVYTVDSLTFDSWPTELERMPEQSLANTRYFLCMPSRTSENWAALQHYVWRPL